MPFTLYVVVYSMVVPEGGGWGGSGLQAGRGTKAIRNMYDIKLTTNSRTFGKIREIKDI